MQDEEVQREGRRIYLVSACLAGFLTRYDGQRKTSPSCLEALRDKIWMPVCPEQLGGLATPRSPAVIVGGDGDDVWQGKATVVDGRDQDVTEQFKRGARLVLQIAVDREVAGAFLKSRSPSCGVAELGVLAALLKNNGIPVREF